MLRDYDLLAMPTIPFPATKIPAPDCSREEYVDAALNMQQNTCPFDVSGHPALTVPCGKIKGLPIGMMLVANHFDEVERDPRLGGVREIDELDEAVDAVP